MQRLDAPLLQLWGVVPQPLAVLDGVEIGGIRSEDYRCLLVEQCAHIDRCGAAEGFDTNAIERLQRCNSWQKIEQTMHLSKCTSHRCLHCRLARRKGVQIDADSSCRELEPARWKRACACGRCLKPEESGPKSRLRLRRCV